MGQTATGKETLGFAELQPCCVKSVLETSRKL